MTRFDFRNEYEFQWFEERAAIMEYEGGLSRDEAESKAYELLLRMRGE